MLNNGGFDLDGNFYLSLWSALPNTIKIRYRTIISKKSKHNTNNLINIIYFATSKHVDQKDQNKVEERGTTPYIEMNENAANSVPSQYSMAPPMITAAPATRQPK